MGALITAGPTDLYHPYGSTSSPFGIPGMDSKGSGAGTSSSEQSSQQQSGQYFQNPGAVNNFAGAMVNPINESAYSYNRFINDPTSHPYFQNALGGLLNALVPSENNARLNLNDQFRAAGNTASSTYGHNAMGLEAELMRNRQQTASQLLTTMFPQITQAMFAPMGQADSLINALKMSQSTGSSTGSSESTSPVPQGGGQSIQYANGGGAGGGGLTNIFSTPNLNTAAPAYQRTQPTNFNSAPYMSPDLGGFDWGSTPDSFTEGQPQDMSGWY